MSVTNDAEPIRDRDGRSREMFARVEQYADLGWHQSGNDVDEPTAQWMVEALEAHGVSATVEDVGFDRWVGQSALTLNDQPIGHLCVFSAWQGAFAGRPMVRRIDPAIGGYAGVLAEPVAEATAAGASALVLATDHPDGALVAINMPPPGATAPHPAGDALPVVLVAGRDAERLMAADADVRLTVSAERAPGITRNVVGLNQAAKADGAGTPLMVTTPLNGWFGCAGERGTGIAVLLDLVSTLRDLPLMVVATGGHELSYFGARVWADRDAGHRPEPAAILHIGASIAVEDIDAPPPRPLISTRMGMTTLTEDQLAPMVGVLGSVGLAVGANTTTWRGEGEVFHELGRPLLSFTGAGRDFHTPQDTAPRATSPESLVRVADAVGEAARLLFRHALGPQ